MNAFVATMVAAHLVNIGIRLQSKDNTSSGLFALLLSVATVAWGIWLLAGSAS